MPHPAHMDDALLLSPLALSAPAAASGFQQIAVSVPYFTSFAANAPVSFQPLSYPAASALVRSESESSSSSSASSSGSFFCGPPACAAYYEPDHVNGHPPSSPTTIVFSSPRQGEAHYTDLQELPSTPSRIPRARSASTSSSSGMPVQSYHNVPASSARPPRRRTLTHAEKHMIWKHARDHPNDSQKKIGKVFGVERSTVSKICKALNKTMEVRNNSGPRPHSGSGNMSSSKFRHIESKLVDWIRSCIADGLVVRDDEIRDQALLIAASSTRRDELVSGFKASATWIEKFKQRHRECFVPAARSAGSMHTRSRTKAEAVPTSQHFAEPEMAADDVDDDEELYPTSSTSSTIFHLEGLSAQDPTPMLDGFYPGPSSVADVDLSLQYTPYSTSAASTFSSISPQSSPELLTPISGSFPTLDYQTTNAPLLPDISEQCGGTYFGMPTADPLYAQGLLSPDYFSADTFRTL